MVAPYETLLTIAGVPLPQASARGIRQTLAEIEQAGNFRRTANLELRNVAPIAARRKFKTTISCDDINAPMWDGLYKGLVVSYIDCVEELYYLTSGGVPFKTVVSGSVRVVGSVTFYRPRLLNCMITEISVDGDEYAASRGWSISAEEV